MSSDRSGNHLPPNRPPEGSPGAAGGEHLAGEREGAGHEEWFMPFIPADQPANPERRPRGRASRRRVAWYVPLVGGCLTLLALLMAAGALLAGVASTLAFHKATTEDRSFTVAGTPTVVVDGTVGDLRVVPGGPAGANQVAVSATKYVYGLSSRRDERDAARLPLDMTQSGDTVTIRPQQRYDPDSLAEHRVDLTITVPPQTNLTITLASGDVHLDRVNGVFNVQLNHGDLTLTNTTLAGNSALRTADGDLHFNGGLASGANVNVPVSRGDADLALPAATTARLDATTGAGDVRVSGWDLPATRSFASASVAGDLAPQPSSTLTARVGAGDITVRASGRSRTSPLPTVPPVPTPPQPPVRRAP